MLRKTIKIAVWLSVASCTHTGKTSSAFLSMLERKAFRPPDKLLFNGAYHRISPRNYHYGVDFVEGKPTRFIDTPYLESPVYFFENGFVVYDEGLILDSTKWINSQKQYAIDKWSANRWGTYTVEGDTIKAIIYMRYYGTYFRRTQLQESFFEGTLLNKDTIRQWRLVPPYPEILISFSMNDYNYKYLTTPRDLHFKPTAEKQFMDSSKAWIHELRKRKN